jgi:signal transduction histidine kinase
MMGRKDIPKTTLAENVKNSHDQVLFLAKMVNDLSTLSRAERGVADATEEIDVAVMVHDLYNQYGPQAGAKGLHFNLDASPQLGTVVASRLYLKELLQNFITNAIKYTQEGSVTLHVKSTKDAITFSVSDTGIGIRKADLENIFKRFYRAEDFRTRETNGTGLGLYVSAKLAKKLGCKINVESRINHGSTFSFSLPRER